MQRIIDPTASATVVAPPALTGTTGYFGPGVPDVSIATRFRYWYATMLQEELMSILAAAGVVVDTTGTVFNQVATTIQSLIGAIPHGVAVFNTPGAFSFTVPAGVTAIEVELWGGGSGSWASTTTIAGGGGSGGGFARKRITGLMPGAVIVGTIGGGGSAGTTAPLAPTAGGASSFGSGPYLSATGGVVNTTTTTSNPASGNLAGVGSGGDVNFYGDDGAQAVSTQGGMGGSGGGAGSGGPNSGTTGRPGYAPGGGASGAGCPTGAANNGAAGASGSCVVRW